MLAQLLVNRHSVSSWSYTLPLLYLSYTSTSSTWRYSNLLNSNHMLIDLKLSSRGFFLRKDSIIYGIEIVPLHHTHCSHRLPGAIRHIEGNKSKPIGPNWLRVQVYGVWDMCTGCVFQICCYQKARTPSTWRILYAMPWCGTHTGNRRSMFSDHYAGFSDSL